MSRFTRWLLGAVIPALVLVGLGQTPALAAVTGTLNAATVSSPNGSDFSWTCTVNPDGQTIYVMGRSWNNPTNGVPGVDTTRQMISGTTPQTLTFSRDGVENQSYGYRCLWYSSPTSNTPLGKTVDAFFLTTSYDGDPPVAMLGDVGPNPVNEDAEIWVNANGTTDPDNDIELYEWNWGDGSIHQGAWNWAIHVYSEPGTYTLTVKAIDAKGLSDTSDPVQIVVNDVSENSPPDADLTANLNTVIEGNEVIADASGSEDLNPGDTLTYDFAWGDGTSTGPQAAPTASHSYDDEGSYTITVTVSDGSLSDTAQVAVTVRTSTLFGSNVDGSTRVPCSNPGVGNCRASDSTRPETFAEALARLDAAYAPEAMRLFYQGLPSTSCTESRNALARERPSTLSWKGDAATLSAGGYDNTLNAWFDCFNRPTRVTYYHEPENPDKPFQTAAEKAGYRAASQYFYTLAKAHPNAANLIVVQIFMDYSVDPVSGRNLNDWYAGNNYVDEIGFDIYNFKEEDSNPSNDEDMAAHQVRRPSLAWAQAKGKPYFIGELGFDVPTGRAAFLTDVGEWAQENDVTIVHYFDSIGTLGDHRLIFDTPAKQAWAAVVAS